MKEIEQTKASGKQQEDNLDERLLINKVQAILQQEKILSLRVLSERLNKDVKILSKLLDRIQLCASIERLEPASFQRPEADYIYYRWKNNTDAAYMWAQHLRV